MNEIKLSKKLQKITQEFVQRLKDTYKEDLISVILYGSAASGEFMEKYSNINLLVVLNDTSLANLKKIAPILKKARFTILNTLFFSPEYIRNSVDAFPIEFLDIKENHLILWGKDLLRDIEIDTRNLRFQCEQELKEKLINIKMAYLRTQDKNTIRMLLFKSSNSVLHILRNLIRLKGQEPAYLKEDLIKQFSELFGISIESFNKIWEVREKELKLSFKQIEDLFFAFTNDLEKIVEFVDKL